MPVLIKAQQNRTGQNRQKLKNRKNIQEQTKPYLQNKQLILACGSRARQRLPADGQKCDMESQVGHIAINRPDKAHQSLIYYARAHTHARSAKMTKNMAVLRSLRSTSARQRSDLCDLLLGHNSPPTALEALYTYSFSATPRVTSPKSGNRTGSTAFACSGVEPTCSEQTTRASVVSARIACTNTSDLVRTADTSALAGWSCS